jgi:hypothetical protein
MVQVIWSDDWSDYIGTANSNSRLVLRADGKYDLFGSHTFSRTGELYGQPNDITIDYRNDDTGSWETLHTVAVDVKPNVLESNYFGGRYYTPAVQIDQEIGSFTILQLDKLNASNLRAEIDWGNSVSPGKIAIEGGSLRVFTDQPFGRENQSGYATTRVFDADKLVGISSQYYSAYNSIGFGGFSAKRVGDTVEIRVQPTERIGASNSMPAGFTPLDVIDPAGQSTWRVVLQNNDQNRTYDATLTRNADGSSTVVANVPGDVEDGMIRVYETFVRDGVSHDIEYVGSWNVDTDAVDEPVISHYPHIRETLPEPGSILENGAKVARFYFWTADGNGTPTEVEVDPQIMTGNTVSIGNGSTIFQVAGYWEPSTKTWIDASFALRFGYDENGQLNLTRLDTGEIINKVPIIQFAVADRALLESISGVTGELPPTDDDTEAMNGAPAFVDTDQSDFANDTDLHADLLDGIRVDPLFDVDADFEDESDVVIG